MNFHELDKFQEWASKVEEAIDKKPSKIKDSSKRLIYWARRIEEIDSVYYNDKIQEYEYRLVSKAIQIIFDQQYKTYLVSSKKHGQYTKARQKKVGRFAYYFQALLLPLAEKIQANKFLKEKIQYYIKDYLPDLLFDLSNIEKHQLDALLEILSKAEELGINNISELTNTIESEILSRQLNYEIMQDLDGESEQVEFKQGVPTNFRNIAKTIAAFASTEGGRIYIGIEDSGEIIGIETKEENWFDKLQLNIDNFVCGNIQPTPRIGLELYTIHDKFVVQIRVPKGSEPLYYLKNIPYVRRLSSSKPATPSDVKRLHLNYFIKTLEGSVSE